jgi:hypothetical protein
MTIECQEHRTAAEADGLVIATANRAPGLGISPVTRGSPP